MKKFWFAIWCFFLSSCVFAASSTQPEDTASDSFTSDSVWPGLKFQITVVKRIDPQNVIIAVRLSTGAKAPPSTYIGFWSGNGLPIGEIDKDHHPLPYSLLKANVIDRATKNQINAVPQKPSKRSYGLSEVITSMHPGEWFQMSVQFPIPVPAPNPDGTIPVQKIDVTLPQAKGPIKGVVVPPL